MTSQELITRVRVQYTKGESLRFTGHLDLQRLWERLLRRTRLPIRYSQGFHRRARLNLASALPLGFVSDSELLDFWMDEPLSIDEIQTRLAATAPPGLDIASVQQVDLSEDSLQSQMHASEYEVEFFDPQESVALQEKVNHLLTRPEIIRKRRKKTYDLRALILQMEVIKADEQIIKLWMQLLAEPAATGRPDEVLDELGYENTTCIVKRTQLILNAT